MSALLGVASALSQSFFLIAYVSFGSSIMFGLGERLVVVSLLNVVSAAGIAAWMNWRKREIDVAEAATVLCPDVAIRHPRWTAVSASAAIALTGLCAAWITVTASQAAYWLGPVYCTAIVGLTSYAYIADRKGASHSVNIVDVAHALREVVILAQERGRTQTPDACTPEQAIARARQLLAMPNDMRMAMVRDLARYVQEQRDTRIQQRLPLQ